MPLVSVIVPVYNHARFLAKRLESITSQTFMDYELILLDDASTDGSDEVCREFSEIHTCELVQNATNSGSPFAQWCKGISLASGTYIWIAESDDFCAPEFLERIVERLEGSPSCALAYCDSIRIDAAGNPLGLASKAFTTVPTAHWNKDFVSNGKQELVATLLLENTIPNASAVVFRRSAWERAGGVDGNLSLCADWLLWASMLAHGNVAFHAEPLNHFRCHDKTVRATRGTWSVLAEQLSTMRRIAEIADLPEGDRAQLRLRVWVLLLDAATRALPSRPELAAAIRAARAVGLRLATADLARLGATIGSALAGRARRS
jgi:hypothetical protein